jgi:hypothetical protein
MLVTGGIGTLGLVGCSQTYRKRVSNPFLRVVISTQWTPATTVVLLAEKFSDWNELADVVTDDFGRR